MAGLNDPTITTSSPSASGVSVAADIFYGKWGIPLSAHRQFSNAQTPFWLIGGPVTSSTLSPEHTVCPPLAAPLQTGFTAAERIALKSGVGNFCRSLKCDRF